ncbi:SAM-dependent methyltransferase [Microbispora sp. RL4-1S]|uniref:SAM-dependent methyltransferase n=1 Tax=Microbispora oryzae TaxID=2806554 RepID=A0A940WRL6_9ACTN|nr:SAM-dependent methyltransferase [Microbispora oryzae]MBP2708647.1 SAM-dependent methyltransferase [Microbispora oryzae]
MTGGHQGGDVTRPGQSANQPEGFEEPRPQIDTTRPSISRVYDYMLGGKDNFAVDRMVAEKALLIAPNAPHAARSNRRFLKRVVRFLAAEAGIRQFLDIGSGLPTQGNVHEIAHEVAPEARVVYVDNDPIVLVHGRALLAENGSTTVVEADIRDPEALLGNEEVRGLIDFDQPVALLLFGILHHLGDEEDPAAIAARLRDALPSGSYLALSHFHNPGPEHPSATELAFSSEKMFNENLGTGRWRTRDEILAYFGDMDLLEPGLVPLIQWRPDHEEILEEGDIHLLFAGGVGRKR